MLFRDQDAAQHSTRQRTTQDGNESKMSAVQTFKAQIWVSKEGASRARIKVHDFLPRELQESLSNEQGVGGFRERGGFKGLLSRELCNRDHDGICQSRLPSSPFLSSSRLLNSERSEKGFQGGGRPGLLAAPHASPRRKGKHEAPGNSLQIVNP